MSSNILNNAKIILVVFLFVVLIMPVVMKIAEKVNASAKSTETSDYITGHLYVTS